MAILIPRKAFFTKGVGVDTEEITSYERALKDAGIEGRILNELKSNVFPQGIELIPRPDGIKLLREIHPPSGMYDCVMARTATDENNRLSAAGIGIAIPKSDKPGYIGAHTGYGMTERRMDEFVDEIALKLLAINLGIEAFDKRSCYSERPNIFRLDGTDIEIHSVVQSAQGRGNCWTTVIAALVFCDYEIKGTIR